MGSLGVSITSERRKHSRALYGEKLKVQAVASSKIGNIFEVKNEAMNIFGKDISEGGFRLSLPTTFKPGSILKVSFKMGTPDTEESEAYVRVVWTDKESHGVQFLMLEDAAIRKIKSFIRDQSTLA
jgi:c-di-GMP-binding flagellar brake protein YcgR